MSNILSRLKKIINKKTLNILFSIVIVVLLIIFHKSIYSTCLDFLENALKLEYAKIVLNFMIIIIIVFILNLIIQKYIDSFFNNETIKKKICKLVVYKFSNKNTETWKNIVAYIENCHHYSIASKIKDLGLDSEMKSLEFEYMYNFNRHYLHEINEYISLLTVVSDKFKHKSCNSGTKEETLNKYEEFIKIKLDKFYKIKYNFAILLNLRQFFYRIIPFILAIFISYIAYYCIDNKIFDKNYYSFFLGTTILFSLFSIMPLMDAAIRRFIISYSYTKTSVNIVAYYMVLSFLFTIVAIYALQILHSLGEIFFTVFTFFESSIFNSEISGLYKMLQSAIIKDIKPTDFTYYLLLMKLIILVSLVFIMYNLVNIYVREYDQMYYEKKIKKYLLPPELIKIISYFLLTIFTIVYFYINLVNQPTLKIYENNNSDSITTVGQDLSLSKNIDINLLVDINQKLNDINEKKTFEDLLPFGIFLLLLSSLLAMSTKNIMDNYFTGLAMKIDRIYDEGDRVKINDSGMLEVKNIGTRSDEFYEIETNSILQIPHKKLAEIEIRNYTRPTLDYRKKIDLYIKDMKMPTSNIPREAEKILLLSAFLNTGVKIPKYDEIKIYKNDTLSKEYKDFNTEIKKYQKYVKDKRGKEYAELEKKDNDNLENSFETIVNNAWSNLFNLNKKMKENNQKTIFDNLFINQIPFNLIKDDSTIGSAEFLIKKNILAIILSISEYNKLFKEYTIHSDENGIRRKYQFFQGKTKEEINKISTTLVNVSFYYYMLSNRLWELKALQTGMIAKRRIDNSLVGLLDVPRVTSSQYFSDNVKHWKVTLLVTLELGEQSEETIHHINMYLDELENMFFHETSNKRQSIRNKLFIAN